jgi:hypothetical protein
MENDPWAYTNPALFAYMKSKIQEELRDGTSAKECFKQLLPKIHLGIIPDGNRRWCKKNGKSLDNYAKMIEEILFGHPAVALAAMVGRFWVKSASSAANPCSMERFSAARAWLAAMARASNALP